MPHPIRLTAQFGDENRVLFQAHFPAPDPDLPGPDCAPALLETGDGATLALGRLCPPSRVNWADAAPLDLAVHAYADPSQAGQARLLWGDLTIPVEEMGARAVAPAAQLVAFRVQPEPATLQARVQVQVAGLVKDQQVRVDGDRGQVGSIPAGAAGEAAHEWLFGYPKPGDYRITVDVVDAQGFRLVRLGESPVQIAEPVDFPKSVPLGARLPLGATAASAQTDAESPSQGALAAAPASLEATATPAQPWLPFRYAYPLWAWTKTYRAAGGSTVSRSLAPGTYLAIRAETAVGGQIWYQTGSYDWIPASSVGIFVTSELRGAELGVVPGPDPAPDPPPDPPPTPTPQPIKRGVVTASRLNVRARPGASADNPTIAQLSLGAAVEIFEEIAVAGALWYRIGVDRWVHSGWVRITETMDPGADPTPPPVPQPLKRGRVTANRLNVRAQPGARTDNPPIDQLAQGALVEIWQEQSYAGAIWYRMGPGANRDRWIHSGYVEIIPSAQAAVAAGILALAGPAPASSLSDGPVTLPLGWVTSAVLNVRAQPGMAATNPAIDQLPKYTRIPILETRTVAGAPWYRIGAGRWVYGGYVGVARHRPRPSSIGASERWVSVCLSEQTVVAYVGDTPVYACLAATGLPGTPTVQGTFRTHWRVDSRRMTGGAPGTSDYYYLEEVTWTCYFYGGYALHTAYWHDAFGAPRSHGCVNMSPYDCWWIYQWSGAGGAKSPVVHVYWA